MTSKKEQLNTLLNRPTQRTTKQAETEENEDMESTYEDTQDETATTSTSQNQNYEMPRFTTHIQGFRFDDLKGSFRAFRGEPGHNIRRWIQHFEENAATFNLNDLQKLVYAKNLVEGQAKLFTEFESKAHNWSMLKAELMREFDKQSNSLLVHQQLAERRKKKSESAIEYLYDMMTIGAQGNVDPEAILTHVTNGMPGHPQTKTILYAAKNIADYKEKLMTYELQQKRTQEAPARSNDEKRNQERTTNKPKPNKQRCNNCGSLKHPSNDCPRKKDGPKCFACNNYGHRSNDDACPKKNERKPTVAAIVNTNGAKKYVTLNGQTIESLIDTGSDISVIQQRTHKRLGLPNYVKSAHPFEGVGSQNTTLGYISTEITIEDIQFRDVFHVIRNQKTLPEV